MWVQKTYKKNKKQHIKIGKQLPHHFHFYGDDLADVIEWVSLLRQLESVRLAALVQYINCVFQLQPETQSGTQGVGHLKMDTYGDDDIKLPDTDAFGTPPPPTKNDVANVMFVILFFANLRNSFV